MVLSENFKIMDLLKRSKIAKSARSFVDKAGFSKLRLKECSVKNKDLMTHFTHHKCGTMWFNKSLYEIAKNFNLKYQNCLQKKLNNDTDIWLEWHSDVDFDILPSYSGSHMIRDPRDVTISAYFYHLWSEEPWCRTPRKELSGKSYQEYLKSLSKQDGIMFEMKNKIEEGNTTGSVIEDMSLWDYLNPNIIELKYENVIKNPIFWFEKVFKKYGFEPLEIEKAIKIVEKCSFQGRTGRKLGDENRKSHMRKGTPGDWKNHFSDDHVVVFKERYGDILVKLGYEKDNNW